MYCGKCGSYVVEGSASCPKCGAQFYTPNNNDIVNTTGYVVPSGIQQNYSSPEKKDTWKWVVVIILLIIVLVMGVLLLFSLKKKEEAPLVNPIVKLDIDKGSRTLMVYLLGSNLESENGAASKDIQEMISSKFDTEALNIYVYTGGSKKWYNDSIDAKKNSIFKVTSDGLEKVETFGEKSMVKADTLTEFIDYVYDESKTDLYDLILWDHGGGPIIGYGVDELHSNSSMTLIDLNKALDNTKLIKNTKFEIIGFDACLMGSVEIANLLKEEANYLIASEETEPGDGWDYLSLKEISSDTTSKEFGKIIVDSYYNYYMELNDVVKFYGYDKSFSVSLSMLDLQNMDSLIKEIDAGFEDLSTDVPISTFKNLSNDASKAAIYGCQGESCYDQVDLYDLIDSASEDIENSEALKKSISKTVVYQKSNIDGTNGMSIFFPVTLKSNSSKLVSRYSNLGFSKNYTGFLTRYSGIIGGDKMVKSSTFAMTPSVSKDVLSVTLPEDLVNNYAKGEYTVFVTNEYGGYFPVYKSSAVQLDGNVMSAKPIDKEMVITDKNGKDEYVVISFEYESDENSTTYAVLAELEKADFTDFKLEVVWFYVRFKNGSDVGEIIDIKPCVTDEGPASKKTYNLNDWTHVMSISYSYTLEDENGEALQEWETGEDIYGSEYEIAKDGFQFRLKDLSKKKNYYYVFRALDNQGNVHVFKKVAVK